MQKAILIPTDFQVESLNTLKLALNKNDGHEVSVCLVYCEYQSDSITELLFYSPNKRIKALAGAEFNEALAIIKNRFSKTLTNLYIDLFHGHNSNALAAFLEARRVQEIYIPQNYTLKSTKNSFDPLPLLKKVQLPIYTMEWSSEINLSSQGNLGALFVN